MFVWYCWMQTDPNIRTAEAVVGTILPWCVCVTGLSAINIVYSSVTTILGQMHPKYCVIYVSIAGHVSVGFFKFYFWSTLKITHVKSPEHEICPLKFKCHKPQVYNLTKNGASRQLNFGWFLLLHYNEKYLKRDDFHEILQNLLKYCFFAVYCQLNVHQPHYLKGLVPNFIIFLKKKNK